MNLQARLNDYVASKLFKFSFQHFKHEITKEKQGHIKTPYLEILLTLYKKLISIMILLGKVIFYT